MARLPSRRKSSGDLCVGLLSGTSADGVEAALCEIRGTGPTLRLRLLRHESHPFGPSLSKRIIGVKTVPDLCALDFELGEKFAQAALSLMRGAKVKASEVRVIGSHGQTVAHLPRSISRVPSTLQIGESAVIAERTGVPVVSDFRVRDMAAGGEGAPLVPYFDWAVLRSPKRNVARALLNLGGIANISAVGADPGETVAFDTGPGNMVLDALAQKISKGKLRCDLDGRLSSNGKVDRALLTRLLKHPFLGRKPPKSAGRETFGEAFVTPLLASFAGADEDLLRTVAAFTAASVKLGFDRHLRGRFERFEGLYVSGGGSRNPTLMKELSERFSPLPVKVTDELGFPEAAKEAACFALLAAEHLNGTPANVPSVTGADRPVVLGKLSP